jgi:hypothetical protein
MSFAENTSVPVDRSKAEIERTLVKYGASHFGSGWDDKSATIGFVMNGRAVRFVLPIPPLANFKETEFQRNGKTFTREVSDNQARASRDQEERRRWRALNLAIKAKLEAVETGIASFESEFLAHIVVGKQTIGEQLLPRIEEFYSSGKLPPLLGTGK